jgi:hypothetical protein
VTFATHPILQNALPILQNALYLITGNCHGTYSSVSAEKSAKEEDSEHEEKFSTEKNKKNEL